MMPIRFVELQSSPEWMDGNGDFQPIFHIKIGSTSIEINRCFNWMLKHILRWEMHPILCMEYVSTFGLTLMVNIYVN